MLTFHLPAEEQEKITLGVTVCLSYLLMIGTMAKTTPACENVPILGKKKYLPDTSNEKREQEVLIHTGQLVTRQHQNYSLN